MDVRIDEDENIETAVKFCYCSTCKKGHKLPKGALTPHTVICAICNFQVVTVTKPDGKSHTICPQCFKYVLRTYGIHCDCYCCYSPLIFLLLSLCSPTYISSPLIFLSRTYFFPIYISSSLIFPPLFIILLPLLLLRNPPGPPHSNDATSDFRSALCPLHLFSCSVLFASVDFFFFGNNFHQVSAIFLSSDHLFNLFFTSIAFSSN